MFIEHVCCHMVCILFFLFLSCSVKSCSRTVYLALLKQSFLFHDFLKCATIADYILVQTLCCGFFTFFVSVCQCQSTIHGMNGGIGSKVYRKKVMVGTGSNTCLTITVPTLHPLVRNQTILPSISTITKACDLPIVFCSST